MDNPIVVATELPQAATITEACSRLRSVLDTQPSPLRCTTPTGIAIVAKRWRSQVTVTICRHSVPPSQFELVEAAAGFDLDHRVSWSRQRYDDGDTANSAPAPL